MNMSEAVLIGFSSLGKTKLRTFLTMLGIIIGIAGVVGIVSVGGGAKRLVLYEFERIGGSNMLWVYRLDRIRQPDGKYVPNRFPDFLEYEDALLIQATCPNVVNVSAELPDIPITVEYNGKSMQTKGIGVAPEYQAGHRWTVQSGRFIAKRDVEDASLVCVIGSEIWQELCDGGDVIGAQIRVNRMRFTVIGIMEEKGDTMATQGWDRWMLFPITTVQRRMFGFPYVGVIFVQATSFETVDKALEEVRRVLKWRHKNADIAFKYETAKDALKEVGKVTLIIKGLLGGVASIALIVGGIGIMNIMLVSVVERTWEIGLRKAVGAKRRDILLQFLIESAVLSISGGLIGILVGVFFGIGVAKLVSIFVFKGVDYPSVVSLRAIAAAFFTSAFIGFFFGLYPANRAAKLTPTEALRRR
jgi:putative ABC transport system permease protein